jgi:hypothetical protein
MTEDESRVSTKLKALQELTNMKLTYSRVMSKFKIEDERGRDILGRGWQDAHATLCHIDTIIRFTLLNNGYEIWRNEAGGTQSAKSKE